MIFVILKTFLQRIYIIIHMDILYNIICTDYTYIYRYTTMSGVVTDMSFLSIAGVVLVVLGNPHRPNELGHDFGC